MPKRRDAWRRYFTAGYLLRDLDLDLGSSLEGVEGKPRDNLAKQEFTRVQVSYPEGFAREPLR